MRRHFIALIAVLALALGACGDDDTDVATPAAGDDDPIAEPVCIGEYEDLLPEYVGLTAEEATERAEGQGYTIREVGADAQTPEDCNALTMDLRDDRVNIELADGVVIAAAIF